MKHLVPRTSNLLDSTVLSVVNLIIKDISINMRNPVLEIVLLMWHFSNIVATGKYISMFSVKVFVPYIFFKHITCLTLVNLKQPMGQQM